MLGGLEDHGVDLGVDGQAVGSADSRTPEDVGGPGHGVRVLLHVRFDGDGRVRGALGDAEYPRRHVPVEHGGVLGNRDLPDRLVEVGQLHVGRSPVGGLDLLTGHGERGTEFDEGQHTSSRRLDPLGWGLDLVDPSEVGRRVCPAVRACQVDQLPGGQVGDQAALGLRLDLPPGGIADRGELAEEMIHHSPPFRVPIPSDPARGRPAEPPSALASASASTSVTGSLVNR